VKNGGEIEGGKVRKINETLRPKKKMVEN